MGKCKVPSEKKTIYVLYIEDNPNDFLLFQRYLFQIEQEDENEFFHLEQVDRVSKGLERLERGGIDLILTDLNLPDAEELESVALLHDHYPSIPIIALTNTYQKSLGLEAVRQGAQDYLLKDELNSHTLKHSIRYAIERKDLEKMKDKFLNTVSHELLTPLAIMKGGVNVLNLEMGGSVTQKQIDILGTFTRSIERLLKIVNNILDFSRLRSGHFKINPQSINIIPLIDEVVDGLRGQLEKNGVVIEEHISEMPHACADPHLITQLLTNLLSNAQRYAKTKITIVAQSDDQMICVKIIDDGTGISPEGQKKLFREFEQVNRADEGQGYKGTGLGLAIAKEIIGLHRGKIWVESDVNKGAQFCFTLPITQSKE